MLNIAGNAFFDNLVNGNSQDLATSIAECFGGIPFRNRLQICHELGSSTFHSILKHLDLAFSLKKFVVFFSFFFPFWFYSSYREGTHGLGTTWTQFTAWNTRLGKDCNGGHWKMAKDESYSDWPWQDRENELNPYTARLFGMQKYISSLLFVLVYMLTWERFPRLRWNLQLA